MRRERDGHTLQTTALVNEAYLRLVDLHRVRWQDRAHFFAMSARLMRRILVDHARSRRSVKRGGGARRVTFDEGLAVSAEPAADLVALDDALQALARIDARKSHVVELRYFGGLSVEETAEALHVSPETVMRDWRLAKAWLLRALTENA
jgi:RNA polymerase sigma-70 factor, ECF subfamily